MTTQSKYYCLAETVFCMESRCVLTETEALKDFQIEERTPDYRIHIDFAADGEETNEAYGYAAIQRHENEIWLSLNKNRMKTVSDWQIFVVLPLVRLLLERGVLVLHSSYIIHEGKAVLFSGDCGCGKSTQALLWEQNRQAEIINGDRSLVYCRDGKVYAGGHFHCGTSGIRKNKSAELKAIVLLSQSLENEVSVPKGIESFQKLLSQCAYDIEKREEIEMATQLIVGLVQNAKVLKYRCCKDISAVEALESVLE